MGTVEANVPQYNTKKANVGPEAKKSEIRRKLTFSPVNTSSDRSALDKLRGVVRGQGRDEQRKRRATHVSFSKPASVVSCCSEPLMPTRMRTLEKNPHGTRPET